MSKINLRIDVPKGMSEDQVRGIMVSLISVVAEVGAKKRKSSYVHHFFQERLDRGERRNIQIFLSLLQTQFQKRKIHFDSNMITAEFHKENEIPEKFTRIFNSFQIFKKKDVSNPTNDSLQKV